MEDVSQFKQTVHTKIAKKEEELDKLDGELYMKLRRKRSFKLYKVRKIGYQLYYFNSKRIKNSIWGSCRRLSRNLPGIKKGAGQNL